MTPYGVLHSEARRAFKAYDVRGIVDEELTQSLAYAIGHAYAAEIKPSVVAVGRDIRLSGEDLTKSLIHGLNDAGVAVLDLGIVPTGAIYHATHALEVDGGIMVTASHNPPEYNGFKFCRGTAAMAGKEIQDLADRIHHIPEPSSVKGLTTSVDIEPMLLEAIIRSAGRPQRTVHLAIDAGNAVPGPLLQRLMDELDVRHVDLYCSWDPTFPHHSPDPTRPQNMLDLGKTVVEAGAEVGIGVDGDGDRLGIVDEQGNFVTPDRLLALFAQDVLEQATEPELSIIYDVKCSMALEQTIRACGGTPIMMRTGHSFLKQALRESPSSPLAGEMSGHFFFNDRWPGHDDALYCAARLVEFLARSPSPKDGGPTISSRLAELPDYPSSNEVKIPLLGERADVMLAVTTALEDAGGKLVTVDGVRIQWEYGWFLCRPSNTESILVIRAEGMTQEALETIVSEVSGRLKGIVDLGPLVEDILS
ncbi:MAG TPA: phosphomannomutase/phosphoglucomutase [Candidatus Poseidoniales archaeon]|nr:phosphomannomutase/phosphoglucomutase [Candidatus Poseidoniales archaeon]